MLIVRRYYRYKGDAFLTEHVLTTFLTDTTLTIQYSVFTIQAEYWSLGILAFNIQPSITEAQLPATPQIFALISCLSAMSSLCFLISKDVIDGCVSSPGTLTLPAIILFKPL